MHRTLKKLLATAEGDSQSVIAVNLDIRGFSEFSRQVDAVDAAALLKRAYLRLLDGPFARASFFKPTGDGLFLVYAFVEKTLEAVASDVLTGAFEAVDMFPTIASGDPMVNFPYPQSVGIGIARGSACRLHAGAKTLDYSGRHLNLAARLMDVARPRGIVVDGDFGVALIPPAFAERLADDAVFVRGIADRSPRGILYTPEWTQVSQRHKQPFDQPRLQVESHEFSLKQLRLLVPNWAIDMQMRPLDPEKIAMRVSFARQKAGKPTGVRTILPYKRHRYELDGDKPEVIVEMAGFLKTLEGMSVTRADSKITVELIYEPA